MAGERRATVARPALLGVGLLAGALVFLVASDLFPYHSINHDEGVYLQQAAMLLDGALWVEPPVPGAVRPWFFIDDGGRLYPKYTPVAAAMFAPGLALGLPRLSLAVIAAANAVLVGLLAAEAFDRRTGVLAAALLVTAPLYLLNSATFLSYAPTTALDLTFAVAYLRAHRRASLRYAALAGLAVGLAFFSRPFTTLLFALPFVGHALVTLGRVWRPRLRGESADRARPVTARLGVVAAFGTGFVGLTLAYNWLQTGAPLVFPYEVFAPEDGIGFGHREILGHERDYTPAVAVDANRRVLWQFLTRWGPLGALGTPLAAVGLLTGLLLPLRRRVGDRLAVADPSALTCRALVAGVAVTVPLGNVYFWGNLNVLADPADPTDGLIAYLGPFYHFDLLVPAAVFGGAGAVALGTRLVALADRLDRPARTAFLAVVVVLALGAAGGAEAAALGDPVERNVEYRDAVATAYEPFEGATFSDALVFVADPFGDWLNHPFQPLRNDPGFDGDVVYVVDRDAAGDAASLAAFPDRQPYRFTYRGRWPPDEGVTPVLEPLAVREGDSLRVETRLGTVVSAQSASVRLEAGGESVQYGVGTLEGETETVTWTVTPESARVDPGGLRRFSDAVSVPVDGPTTVSLAVTFTQPGGSTVTYRQDLTVVAADGEVRALWPPEERVCRLTTDCGREGTYVEGGDYPAGVSLSANATAVESDG